VHLVQGDDIDAAGANVGEGFAQELRGDFEMVIGSERIAAARTPPKIGCSA
jgi:hypothetical protein